MSRALLLTIACLIMAFARTAAGADGSALFADGERAFAAGEYQEALRLFTAAREAGSTGPSSYYNIGVCQYRLRDYDAAEGTFATLAAEFPALRELAEYNRGLALRANGNLADARVAFERARSSIDDKIVGARERAARRDRCVADRRRAEMDRLLCGRRRLRRQRGAAERARPAEQRSVEPARGGARRPDARFRAQAAALRCECVRRSLSRRRRFRSDRGSVVARGRATAWAVDADRRPDAGAQHAQWRRVRGAHRRRHTSAPWLWHGLHFRSPRGLRRYERCRSELRLPRRLSPIPPGIRAAYGRGSRSRRLRRRAQ